MSQGDKHISDESQVLSFNGNCFANSLCTSYSDPGNAVKYFIFKAYTILGEILGVIFKICTMYELMCLCRLSVSYFNLHVAATTVYHTLF